MHESSTTPTRDRGPHRALWTLAFLAAGCTGAALEVQSPAPAGESLTDPRETHFGEIRQLTFQGENAEAYWAFDGSRLVYQSTP
ncbi:MAG: hypothetical protein HKO53_11115, partial [Gemmatimonadetes bacterium]|nr:hypothetical protein [Gemmatimonadota bacterium]